MVGGGGARLGGATGGGLAGQEQESLSPFQGYVAPDPPAKLQWARCSSRAINNKLTISFWLRTNAHWRAGLLPPHTSATNLGGGGVTPADTAT